MSDSTPRGPGRKKSLEAAAAKPATVPPRPDAFPPSLAAARVWVCWRWRRVRGRWTKPPVSAHTGHPCDVTDPAALADLPAALARVRAGEADGVGVALAAAGLLGVDLDDCRDPETGEIEPWALEVVAAVGSYAEVSPSGTGVKVLAVARKPGPRCRAGAVEVYDAGRYFTLTGYTLPGSPADPRPAQAAVDALYARLFPDPPPSDPAPATTGTLADHGDDALLGVAFAARNGGKLRRLYDGDAAGYGSDSEADLALCSMLAFYLRTPERVDAAFRRSGRYRVKWDRADYRAATLTKAFAGRTEFYDPRRRPRPVGGAPAGDGPAAGGPDGGLPEIVLGHDQGRVNDAAALALGRADGVYQRGGQLVQVLDHPSDSADDDGSDAVAVRRPAGALVVRDLPPAVLQDQLSRVALFVRPVERKDGTVLVPAPPPAWCVAAVHARGRWAAVPPLAGVVAHPVLLPDGAVLAAAGYHRPSGLLVRPPGGLAVAVPESPTRQDAQDALVDLLLLVGDFPFQSPAYEAAWLAALLTLPARPAFAGPAPLFLIDGNTRGVGKGLLRGRGRPDRPRGAVPGHELHPGPRGTPEADHRPRARGGAGRAARQPVRAGRERGARRGPHHRHVAGADPGREPDLQRAARPDLVRDREQLRAAGGHRPADVPRPARDPGRAAGAEGRVPAPEAPPARPRPPREVPVRGAHRAPGVARRRPAVPGPAGVGVV